MTDETGMKKLPRFKKIPGVPTLKTYPIEGMERGIEAGGSIGALLGIGLCVYWGVISVLVADLVVIGGLTVVGAFFGFLLGALWDKITGKWDT